MIRFAARVNALGVLAVFWLVGDSAAHAACYKANEPDQVAEGRLVMGRFKDFANRPERAYILRLRSPACLEGTEETDQIKGARTIHVHSSDDGVLRQIGRLVGKNVRVVGEPFGQHTAHHHAPIVMLLTAIAPL